MSESFAWQYFKKDVKGESAVCKECNAQIKCRGWSTSGLIRHLKNKHNIEKPVISNTKRLADAEPSISNKRNMVQQTPSCFVKKETCAEIITKLATVDGIPVNAITKSEFIRKALIYQGYSLPKNQSQVMELIHSHYEEIKKKVCSKIIQYITSGSRFSLLLDEYTSLNNRRYLNINLHKSGGSFCNLGMLQISGSFPAEVAAEIVERRLDEFNVSLEKHVVACVTDGAAVMVKFGKSIPCEHQLCYAHGIHLAVCDVLYGKNATAISATESEEIRDEDDSPYLRQDEDLENEDFSTAVDLENDCCEVDISYESPVNCDTINVSMIISKVRKIARFFRKSPLKNQILQKYVQEEHGKKLQLMLDSKTRWNILLAMLERILEI